MVSYKDAGVDIEAGDALVEAIKPLAQASARPGVIGGLGGFGALFRFARFGFCGPDPGLLHRRGRHQADGGHRHRAARSGGHRPGRDVRERSGGAGAEPLFFLDYFATGKLAVADAARVVAGIAEGCRLAGCALVGGETAEMPGMYAAGHYDLAGFAVGAVERGRLLPEGVVAGDTILGLPSSGVHSNGFSLVRRICSIARLGWSDPAPWSPGEEVGAALMVPTRLYVKPLLALHRAGLLRAAAHITGGGLVDNVPRALPPGLGALIDRAWPVPPVFSWLATAGNVSAAEMLRVFNCGIGMALIVSNPQEAFAVLAEHGETPRVIGQVIEGDGTARFDLPDGWLR